MWFLELSLSVADSSSGAGGVGDCCAVGGGAAVSDATCSVALWMLSSPAAWVACGGGVFVARWICVTAAFVCVFPLAGARVIQMTNAHTAITKNKVNTLDPPPPPPSTPTTPLLYLLTRSSASNGSTPPPPTTAA